MFNLSITPKIAPLARVGASSINFPIAGKATFEKNSPTKNPNESTTTPNPVFIVSTVSGDVKNSPKDVNALDIIVFTSD